MGHSPFLPPLVIMGVSGTGKTVLGAQVAMPSTVDSSTPTICTPRQTRRRWAPESR